MFININRLEAAVLDFYRENGVYPSKYNIFIKLRQWKYKITFKDLREAIKMAIFFDRVVLKKNGIIRLTTEQEKNKKFQEILEYVRSRR